MKKRFYALLVASVMMLSSIPGVSASNVSSTEQLYTLADNEIQATVETVMDDVYRQLEEQDALVLLDLYRQILEPEIRTTVMEKYGLSSTSMEAARVSGQRTYYMTNGGVITYLSEFDDYAPTEVVSVYLDRDRAYDYILDSQSFTVRTVIREALGFIPVVSDISSFLFDLESKATASSLSSIKDAKGYAKIVNTYSREFDTSASVLTGWSTYSAATTPSNSVNHTVSYFSAY